MKNKERMTNYSAWAIDNKGFSHSSSDKEKLLFFAKYGILAPSGHNTQPWLIKPHEKKLDISINQDHHLSIDGSGLLSVEPYISIGCFIETFCLAARGFGYTINVEYQENKIKTDSIVSLSILKKILPDSNLLNAIVQRVSNRESYNKTSIPKHILEDIIGNEYPDICVTTLTAREDIDYISEETSQGITTIMSNPLYRTELSHWVRPNHTRKYDGMPGFTHGFGTLKSLLSKPAIKRGAKLGPQSEKSAKLIRDSAALIIVRSNENTIKSFLHAGMKYSEVCTKSTVHGYASSALGASVLDPTTSKRIKEKYEFDDRPIYILRLGKQTKFAKNAPRWPLEKVTSL
jgi:hypothetical protein